jgi:hypothetical protein
MSEVVRQRTVAGLATMGRRTVTQDWRFPPEGSKRNTRDVAAEDKRERVSAWPATITLGTKLEFDIC